MSRKFSPGHYCAVIQNSKETFPQFLKRIERYIDPPEIAGLKFLLPWKQVEPKRGEFVWQQIDGVVELARSRGKRVVIELKDRIFGDQGCKGVRSILPLYIIEAGHYFVSGAAGAKTGQCMPKVFLPAYMDEWIRVLRTVHARYDADPAVEMVQCLNETALGKPIDGKFNYTFAAYTKQLLRLLAELPKGKTRFLCSINFLGGPNSTYVKQLIDACVAHDVAINWPDPLLGQKMTGVQDWCSKNPGKAVVAPDADSSFLRYDPKTNKGDVPAVLNFYVDRLGASYVFWQPVFSGKFATPPHQQYARYFERHMIPSLQAGRCKVNRRAPVRV